MSNAIPIFKRELNSYFVSPIAYVVLTIFLLVSGYFFFTIFTYYAQFSMQAMQNPYGGGNVSLTEGVLIPFFGNISVFMLLMLPLLTMRLFAEEKKSGTIELLLTYPVRDSEAIFGKYLAALAIFALMLLLTFYVPLFLGIYGTPDPGAIVAGYFGFFLLGAAFIAFGLFASSITENQIVAAVITFGFLLLLWIIGWSAGDAGPGAKKILEQLSIIEHFDPFSRGIVDTRDIIYYGCFIGFFLFLTGRVLESKKWRS